MKSFVPRSVTAIPGGMEPNPTDIMVSTLELDGGYDREIGIDLRVHRCCTNPE